MSNSSDKKVRHFEAIALRFLKETKLLPYWKEYLDTKAHKSRSEYKAGYHWADKVFIVNIFGKSKFTDFLNQKGIYFYKNRCSFSLFAAFLEAFYPMSVFQKMMLIEVKMRY